MPQTSLVYEHFTPSAATGASNHQNEVGKDVCEKENCHTTLFTYSKTVNPLQLYFEVA